MPTLKQLLKNKLTKKELNLLPSSYDVIGSIIIFSEFPKELEKKEKLIAETLIKHNKQILTVAKKIKKHSGLYRTKKIKIIAGKKTKITTHKESNCILKLNVETCYFSPRLSNERLRIASLVKPNESILVMFSGIGIYLCIIAKNSKPKEIYGIEINPEAHKYALENIMLNKLFNVKLYKGDVKKIIPKLNKKFDRILMPLPKSSENFLDTAKLVSKKGTVIYYYTFAKENEFEKQVKIIKKYFKKIKILNIVKCGAYSPYVYRICINFKIINL